MLVKKTINPVERIKEKALKFSIALGIAAICLTESGPGVFESVNRTLNPLLTSLNLISTEMKFDEELIANSTIPGLWGLVSTAYAVYTGKQISDELDELDEGKKTKSQ